MYVFKKSSIKYRDANGNMQDAGALLGSSETDGTFTKPGVAADAKAVGDKFSELSQEFVDYIKPEKYGAKGDGVTDDSSAIQQAINEAVNGKIVYLSDKTYKISTGLVLDKKYAQFHCDGLLDYSGTDAALTIAYSYMNVYVNCINAPNGTAVYVTANQHQIATNNVKVNRIENSVKGLYLITNGTDDGNGCMSYNKFTIGAINSTEVCVLINGVKSWLTENWYHLGNISGAEIGIKIVSDASSTYGTSANRFFSGVLEGLQSTGCGIYLENTSSNTFEDFRAEEVYGENIVVFVGKCNNNDIALSTISLGGVNISNLGSGSVGNILRGCILTGKPYVGGYSGGFEATVSYAHGIVYNPMFADIGAVISKDTFTDKKIRQMDVDGNGSLCIPTVLTLNYDISGTYTLGSLYSEYGSIARGFPITFVFAQTSCEVKINDYRGNTIIDNTTGKYSGKSVSVKWVGFDKTSSKNIWDVNIVNDVKEFTSNKITELDEFSTNEQYPSAKCVFDMFSGLDINVPTYSYHIDENGNLIQVQNPPYKNVVTTGVDTNGSSLKYTDGYRISASNVVTAQSGTVLTGFIPCEGISDSDVIRTDGAEYVSELYCGIVFYDSSFNVLGGLRLVPDAISLLINTKPILQEVGNSLVVNSDGVASLKINFHEYQTSLTPPAYFRLFAKGVGADLIVTRNEEIVPYDSVETNIGNVKPAQKTETWTFTYEDGSTETKKVVLA